MSAGGAPAAWENRDDARSWFEPVYADADGDPAAVPWARMRPDPHLVAWLDQPELEVAGSDVIVVGCGLGDDAALLADRGCRVTAFDVSGTAVEWARRRFPDRDVDWQVGDLFDPPAGWISGFGLVVEIRTVQSFPEHLRQQAMQAVAGLVGPGGFLLHVGLLATSAEAAERWQGPPWALAPSELGAYRASGLQRVALEHPDQVSDDAMQVRLTFHRPDA